MTSTQTPASDLTSTEACRASSALEDLLVVELATGVAGPYCGKMLADFGADVIKVELPEGDPSRAVGPFPAGDADAGALFLWLNTNKRGITLDWRTRAGRRVLRELLSQADVLVDSRPTPTLSRLRLGPKSLAKLNPRLIVTSVTPFGRTGPWRDRPATDLTISALGGMSYLNGAVGEEPLREPGPQAEVVAGIFGYIGTLAALADRAVTGQGQAVDLSAMEAMLSVLTPYVTEYSYQGTHSQRGPRSSANLFRCQDGYVSMILTSQNAWLTLAKALGLGSTASESDVATGTSRYLNPDRVREVLEPALQGYTKLELFAMLMDSRINVGMVQSISDLKADQHLEARQYFAKVAGAGRGEVVYPGAPFRLAACPSGIRRLAPRLGEHNDEVLSDLLGYSVDRRAALRCAGVARGEGGSDR